MYVLQLDEEQRTLLLSVLEGTRNGMATELLNDLKAAERVFGIAYWSDADIESALKSQEVTGGEANIAAVRESRQVRNIADRMVERGWEVLQEAASQLT
jgi:hypothetical protein